MHITLTGNLGSGKSTIGKIMSEKYGYEIYSTGKVIRELAAERGISVLEMNQLMQSDPQYDNLVDDTTRRISLEHKEDLFFDSRLAWHFAVNTFKVFLSVDIDEAARRVYNDNRGDVEAYSSVEEARSQLIDRAHTEDTRYKDIYGIDYFRFGNYNLVLDSTYSAPELLASILQEEKERYEAALAAGEQPATRILLSPNRLAGQFGGNVRDNELTYESTADVRMNIERIEVLSGIDQIEEAARAGYEFISVRAAE